MFRLSSIGTRNPVDNLVDQVKTEFMALPPAERLPKAEAMYTQMGHYLTNPRFGPSSAEGRVADIARMAMMSSKNQMSK
jgi:hypothetical protein